MAIVIATATEREMRAAFGFMAEPPAVEPGRPVDFELTGWRLKLVVTGVGLLNASLALGRLAGEGSLAGVVNLGVAGSFDTRALDLREPFLVRREVWPEFGLLGEAGLDPRGLGFGLGEAGGQDVWDTLDLAPRQDAARMGIELPRGWPEAVSLSVSGVTGTPERAAMLAKTFDADVENMEGFALAFGCARLGLPFLELRTVSNLVGSRRAEDWDLDGALDVLGPITAGLFMGREPLR